MPRKITINDENRRQWVLNDEGLYDTWISWSSSNGCWNIKTFIKSHRKLIDEVINNVTSGKHSQHYLKYGG